ncbi:MAG: Na+/H+ antiporter subunit E [Deltaproteobacteria bacterium]|nr:Na+/H+ antiporter subunit E [Deltaproteobacteria bacterium]
MKHTFYLTMTLVAFWLLLSGHYTPFVLSCGFFSILITVYIALRMDVVDDEAQPIHLTSSILFYWLWLTKEVVLANIAVCRRIWSPRLNISPTVICVDASQKTPLGIMLYANSITVTPGTVCINIEGNKLEVHALTWSAAQDLLSGEMDRRVSQLEV